MRLQLDGLWQISPLTDLSIPQDDITFPAPLSAKLPDTLSEEEIAAQEWHLMHDIEVDDAMLACPFVELVIAGVDYFAEVRLNGVAVFDCDGSQEEYRKDIRPYMQAGRNRFEILFLEEEEGLLLEEDMEEEEMSVEGLEIYLELGSVRLMRPWKRRLRNSGSGRQGHWHRRRQQRQAAALLSLLGQQLLGR